MATTSGAAPPSVRFRTATVQDAPAIADLINTAFRNDGTTQVFLAIDHANIDMTSAAAVAAKIAQPNTAILVAEAVDDGAIVAHCSMRLMEDGKTAWFEQLAVDVRRKSRGLGGQVLAHAECYAREKLGARRMEFDVVNTRVELRAWYTKRGYSLTGKTAPFPYAFHGDWQGVMRDDLEFVLFGKDLVDLDAAPRGDGF